MSGKSVTEWDLISNAGMDWQEALARHFEDRSLRAISEKLGFSKNRLYNIVNEGSKPNVLDALKICWYLGVDVEAIFGDSAEAELVAAKSRVKRPLRRFGRDIRDLTDDELEAALWNDLVDETEKVDPDLAARLRARPRPEPRPNRNTG